MAKLSLADYDYELPKRLIAQHPAPRRTDARLLLVDRTNGSLQHYHIRDLPTLLRTGDTLVVNDTRVVPARLVGIRDQTGGRWEGLFLSADELGNWRLLAKTRGKLAAGEHVTLVNQQLQSAFRLRLLLKEESGSWIARPESSDDALTLLEQVGRVPLPPYIRAGEMDPTDRERYQTVYADPPGAVAAPTAGLHLTQALLDRLAAAGVTLVRVTLHVGLDTFKPVTVENLLEHPMHSEWCRITPAGRGPDRRQQATAGAARLPWAPPACACWRVPLAAARCRPARVRPTCSSIRRTRFAPSTAC